MSDTNDAPGTSDPFRLARFLDAQTDDYARALAEIESGRKRSHWMWYIFPQLAGLGSSGTAQFYAIQSLDEARAYLAHPVLGARLLACAEAAVRVEGKSAEEIFGGIDAMKLRSSATLFALVAEPGSVFERLLAKFYRGSRDPRTLELLGTAPEE
jgi:uncharacterized protein (DUF1810 family)